MGKHRRAQPGDVQELTSTNHCRQKRSKSQPKHVGNRRLEFRNYKRSAGLPAPSVCVKGRIRGLFWGCFPEGEPEVAGGDRRGHGGKGDLPLKPRSPRHPLLVLRHVVAAPAMPMLRSWRASLCICLSSSPLPACFGCRPPVCCGTIPSTEILLLLQLLVRYCSHMPFLPTDMFLCLYRLRMG